jgi:hypothetical protein
VGNEKRKRERERERVYFRAEQSFGFAKTSLVPPLLDILLWFIF